MSNTRIEHDLLGDAPVPAQAYWGVHTLRAIENYPITGKPIGSYPELVRALALIKQAAALAHKELGQLDATRADAIVAACQEVAGGKLHDQFVVDVIQGGAGTSTRACREPYSGGNRTCSDVVGGSPNAASTTRSPPSAATAPTNTSPSS